MKKGLHPDYGPVAFRDRATGELIVTGSTLVNRPELGTVVLDGTSYPVIDVDVSSFSHPLWTGKSRRMDSEGRVERFERRYGVRR